MHTFTAQGIAAVAALAVIVYVSWRVMRSRPGAPANRFRFLTSQAPALGAAGMLIREDVGPGTVFRLIADGPHDTSPRSGSAHNVFADCGLQHTDRAAWVAQEFGPAKLLAIYEARVTLLGELNPGPGGGGHAGEALMFHGVPLVVDAAFQTTDGQPRACSDERPRTPCFADSGPCEDIRDPLGVGAPDCTTGECPTPAVCQQVGGCADAVPTTNPKD